MIWHSIDTVPINRIVFLYSEKWGTPLVGWIDNAGYVWMAVGGNGRMAPRNSGRLSYWAEMVTPDNRTISVAPVANNENDSSGSIDQKRTMFQRIKDLLSA